MKKLKKYNFPVNTKVLVTNSFRRPWRLARFVESDGKAYVVQPYGRVSHCIPYASNKQLCGRTL